MSITSKEKRIIKICTFSLIAVIFVFGFICSLISKIPELQSDDFIKNYAPIIGFVSQASTVILLGWKFFSTFRAMVKMSKDTANRIENIEKDKTIEENRIAKKVIPKKKRVESKKIAESDRIEIFEVFENDKLCIVAKSKNQNLSANEIWNELDKLTGDVYN